MVRFTGPMTVRRHRRVTERHAMMAGAEVVAVAGRVPRPPIAVAGLLAKACRDGPHGTAEAAGSTRDGRRFVPTLAPVVVAAVPAKEKTRHESLIQRRRALHGKTPSMVPPVRQRVNSPAMSCRGRVC